MAKFYGKVGYAETVETEPGVWIEKTISRSYYGDVLRNIRKLQATDQVNDDINISNEISIVADPYAYNNFHAMRYVEYMGAKWKITSVEVSRPRLILSIGGVWNGNED